MPSPARSAAQQKRNLIHSVAFAFLVAALVCYVLSFVPAMAAFFALGLLLELAFWATVVVASSQRPSQSG
jgi:hypothetical protein